MEKITKLVYTDCLTKYELKATYEINEDGIIHIKRDYGEKISAMFPRFRRRASFDEIRVSSKEANAIFSQVKAFLKKMEGTKSVRDDHSGQLTVFFSIEGHKETMDYYTYDVKHRCIRDIMETFLKKNKLL